MSIFIFRTAVLLLRILAQYCALLENFSQCVSELLLNVVEILKNFNSRTCQLILGAGALQLVGLKTISVKHLGMFNFLRRNILVCDNTGYTGRTFFYLNIIYNAFLKYTII